MTKVFQDSWISSAWIVSLAPILFYTFAFIIDSLSIMKAKVEMK